MQGQAWSGRGWGRGGVLERMFLHVLLRSLAGMRRLRAEGGAWDQGMLEATAGWDGMEWNGTIQVKWVSRSRSWPWPRPWSCVPKRTGPLSSKPAWLSQLPAPANPTLSSQSSGRRFLAGLGACSAVKVQVQVKGACTGRHCPVNAHDACPRTKPPVYPIPSHACHYCPLSTARLPSLSCSSTPHCQLLNHSTNNSPLPQQQQQ